MLGKELSFGPQRMNKRLDAVAKLIEHVSFKKIFLFWLLFMFVFGILYFALSQIPDNGVTYKGEQLSFSITGFLAAEYFSFITSASASLGYGDILPIGFSRMLAVIEAIAGLMLFGIIIAKVVSVKQERLLQEVYNISFDDTIARLRSALYIFRTDVTRFVERGTRPVAKKEISELHTSISGLSNALTEMMRVVAPQKTDDATYLREVDDLSLDLLVNSVEDTAEKMREFVAHMGVRACAWKDSGVLEKLRSVTTKVTSFTRLCEPRAESSYFKEKLLNITSAMNETLYLLSRLENGASMRPTLKTWVGEDEE